MTYAIEYLLENIAGLFNKGLPFVAFKSPDENKVHLLWQNTDALHYVTPEARFGFVMATYSHEKTPHLLKPTWSTKVGNLSFITECEKLLRMEGAMTS